MIFLFQKRIYQFSMRRCGGRFFCNGLLFNCKLRIRGKGHTIIIQEGARLHNCLIEISGNNNYLFIGKDSFFVEGGRFRIEDCNNKIIIGERCSISEAFFSVAEIGTIIEIGNDCLLSSKIIIRTSDSHSILDMITHERINHGKNVSIGDFVWIGYGVNILKGCSIGNHSIIGTHSLVTSSISEHSIAAGIPARVIKRNIEWVKKRILHETKV